MNYTDYTTEWFSEKRKSITVFANELHIIITKLTPNHPLKKLLGSNIS